jgi:hypothetical protein
MRDSGNFYDSRSFTLLIIMMGKRFEAPKTLSLPDSLALREPTMTKWSF